MKYAQWLSAAFVAAAVVLVPAASSAGQQDFTLVNRTGYTISQVYVSQNDARDWQEDVLGEDTLSQGDSTHITFHRGTDDCVWDLKVVYLSDDSSAEWSKFDLCTISKITLYYDSGTGKTSATWE